MPSCKRAPPRTSTRAQRQGRRSNVRQATTPARTGTRTTAGRGPRRQRHLRALVPRQRTPYLADVLVLGLVQVGRPPMWARLHIFYIDKVSHASARLGAPGMQQARVKDDGRAFLQPAGEAVTD